VTPAKLNHFVAADECCHVGRVSYPQEHTGPISMLAVFALFYPVILIRAGFGDLRTMTIPDRLIMLLLAGYLVAIPLAGLSLAEVAWSSAAAILVFALGFVAFTFQWMGGGDVKLLTAAALWLGAENTGALIFYTSLFGAILTLAVLGFRAMHLPIAWQGRDWIARLHRRDTGVPYGVAIAAASLLIYWNMPWVAALR
jgi:prepilin peptidase CpaA